jgi:hypothetical protein
MAEFSIMASVSSGESRRQRRLTMHTQAVMSSSSITTASSANRRTVQFLTALIPATSSGIVSMGSPVWA